jgi:hypothetical protein
MIAPAHVLPMSRVIATWGGRFAFHPISGPAEVIVQTIPTHLPKDKRA